MSRIENAMVVDSWWGEAEYGVSLEEYEEMHEPAARLRRNREAYEEAEYGREHDYGNESL